MRLSTPTTSLKKGRNTHFRMKKVYLYTALIFALSLALFAACSESDSAQEDSIATTTPVVETVVQTPAPTPSPTPDPTPVTIVLAGVGDAMVHDSQMIYNYDPRDDVYNFLPSLIEIKPNIEAADFAIANLETTLTGEEAGYSGYPIFNSPNSFITALQAIGFDLVTLGNNHVTDYGEEGIANTLANLDALDMDHTGLYMGEEDYYDYYITNIKGINVAVIAYAYESSSIERQGESYISQRLWEDEDLVKEDIKNVRALGADVVVLSFHWGEEFSRSYSSAHEDLAKEYIAAGADIILGHHPHVVQPIKRYTVETEDGTTREGVVAYSLGNFICNQRDRYNIAGIVLYLPVTMDVDGSISIGQLSYVPTLIRHTRITFKLASDHRVIPAGVYLHNQTLYDSLDNWYRRDQEKVTYAYEDMVELIDPEVATPLDGTYIEYPFEIYVSPADQAWREEQGD